MKEIKFPKELDLKVDLARVSWPVMKEWVARRVTELLGGLEEEVLISMIHNLLTDTDDVDPRQMHMDLTPFLEKNTGLFMKVCFACCCCVFFG